MASIIDELLNPGGTVPPDELANLLRQKEEVGMVGQLSGSKRLAPLGTAMRGEAMDTAAALGEGQQKVTLESWKAQMAAAQKQADRDARASEGRMNRASREGIASERNASAMGLLKARQAGKLGTGGYQTLDSFQNTLNNLNELASTADEAQGMSGWSNSGLMTMTDVVPGSPARKLKELMVPLMSMEALDKLSALRAEAQAMGQKGSGLGQVTQNELELLKGARKSLDAAQGEEQLDRALKYLAKQYRSSMKNIQREIDKLRLSSEGSDAAGVQGDFQTFMQGLDDEIDSADSQG